MPSAGHITVRRKLAEQWEFYIPAMLSIPLLTLVLIAPDWRTTLAAVAVALVLGAVAGQPYTGYPHYAAPAAGLMVVLLVRGLRLLHAMGRRRGAAPGTLFRLIVLSLVPLFAVNLVFYAGCPCPPVFQFSLARADILKTLQAEPGRHLVLVRYGQEHSIHQEWVYNEADLDAARVVWARNCRMNRTSGCWTTIGNGPFGSSRPTGSHRIYGVSAKSTGREDERTGSPPCSLSC